LREVNSPERPGEPGSGSDSHTLAGKVASWLSTQGYPLEMRVAAAMRQGGLGVRQSVHYSDAESAKSREADVVGTTVDRPGLAMALACFVVECKAASKPWVLFTSPHTLAGYNRLFAFGVTNEAVKAGFDHPAQWAEELEWFKKDGPVGYNLQEAFADGSDRAYGAATSVVKAAMALVQPREGEWQPPIRLAFPAIVVDAPLFECSLDDEGKPRLVEIALGWLFCDVCMPGYIPTCIRIVGRRGLAAYMSEVAEVRSKLFGLLGKA